MGFTKQRLTYANVVASIALFVALGGVGYAAIRIPDDSVGTKQLKQNAVRGVDARESTFGQVPSAAKTKSASALNGYRITTQTEQRALDGSTGTPIEVVCPNDGLAIHGSESASPSIVTFSNRNYGPFQGDSDRSRYSVGASNLTSTSATVTVRLSCLQPTDH